LSRGLNSGAERNFVEKKLGENALSMRRKGWGRILEKSPDERRSETKVPGLSIWMKSHKKFGPYGVKHGTAPRLGRTADPIIAGK